jgi:UDP-N-acetylglucosamine--N-acetylmuramyl-(pentapeptide) pyrophosphoryl-undecaprenol N-acetylglucosamine transferase
MTTPILIAGGGTGGHVFPALAVADALCLLGDVDVTMVGTRRGLEMRVVPVRGYRLELLDVEPIKGGGALQALRGALAAVRSMRTAFALVRRLAPKVVLSVGGYAAGPVALAAALRGIPVTVFEPNRTVGLTNRILAPLARRAYVSWAETGESFLRGTVRVVGVPLRPGFVPSLYTAQGTYKVLIMGGSQGAAALNERLPQAMAQVARHLPSLEILHQAGRDRDTSVRRAYEREGVGRVTVVPFLDDVSSEITYSDLVVARAGAATVAEISAIGRASLLVPFPYAANDHQRANARALQDAGGALCLDQTQADSSRLAHEILELLKHDARRTNMADAARAHGRPAAAHDVAVDLLRLAGLDPDIPVAMNGGRKKAARIRKPRREVN